MEVLAESTGAPTAVLEGAPANTNPPALEHSLGYARYEMKWGRVGKIANFSQN